MTIVLICLLLASFAINATLALLYFKKTMESPPPKGANLTQDAQALLQDLMSGPALLKVEYLDRSEVLIRSPRHR